MLAGTVSVDEELRQLTGQVNALERASERTEQAAAAADPAFPAAGPTIATVPLGL